LLGPTSTTAAYGYEFFFGAAQRMPVENNNIYAKKKKENCINSKQFENEIKPKLIASNNSLDKNIWDAKVFENKICLEIAVLENCVTGLPVEGKLLKSFWTGFRWPQKRLKGLDNKPMILKLKDWPTNENFKDKLEDQFADFMRCAPMRDYTTCEGKFNLINRLPKVFNRPDIGPKMYSAYGLSKTFTRRGTTNLHLDISDAINIMVCDTKTPDQNISGALWHIFDREDTEKLRSFLKKVENCGVGHVESRPDCDPIHDQTHYLDDYMLKRLNDEQNVIGRAFTQHTGETVVIPAGCPHQVKNLSNCIKIAVDFISPQNVADCLRLSNEFRMLSGEHTNHDIFVT
jgi:lysine-specific demethylase 3